MYAVEIITNEGPTISRFFSTIKAARKWAVWLISKNFSARILKGGQGGEVVV
jgi:hypothetical protein